MIKFEKKTNERIYNFGLKGSAKKKNQFHKRKKPQKN
jgi:hypothetical protein